MDAAKDRVAPKGMYRVLGIDKFANEHWVDADYATLEEALEQARTKTQESACDGDPDGSIATVFYVYDDTGAYRGGDIYEENGTADRMVNQFLARFPDDLILRAAQQVLSQLPEKFRNQFPQQRALPADWHLWPSPLKKLVALSVNNISRAIGGLDIDEL